MNLAEVGHALVNQQKARVLVPARVPEPEFWFGGGNMISDSGNLYVCGRYRDGGDSRTGLAKGTRGNELAVFRSSDQGQTWQKTLSFSKQDLNLGNLEVLSIEGSALYKSERGVELFISTEKSGRGYPKGYEEFLKPGTGIWSIDRIFADRVEDLSPSTLTEVLRSEVPGTIHVKDPLVYHTPEGHLALFFCYHPFTWASSNTGYALRRKGASSFDPPVFNFFPRGLSWDVAITRTTAVVDIPDTKGKATTVIFYDGGESLRRLDEHDQGKKRPRGYSCEEIGGMAWLPESSKDGFFGPVRRVSEDQPMFTSPFGRRTSRYVDVLLHDGTYYVTWQQSQKDGSQPLVLHTISAEELGNLL